MSKQANESTTFLDALVSAIKRAGAFNKNDQAAPAVVLWTDKERQWEALLPRLRERLAILTFDAEHYVSQERRGPAYYLRCMIAGTLPEDRLPKDVTPVIYLPGVSKQEMRAVEECPKPLQPLVELQYRGVLWTQKNGRDWTIAAFLQAKDDGLGIIVGADNATKDAVKRALPKLADEPVANLEKEAPLRAPFFDALLNPDEVRNLLLWMNDPVGYPNRGSQEEWASFCGVCRREYGFDPEKDGPVTAAQLLGRRQGNWNAVWRRFTESARSYSNLPDLMQRARPQQLQLFEPREPWPQDNRDAETRLRDGLSQLQDKLPDEARATIYELEKEHGPRRSWVWAELGRSPLASALEHLVQLAKETTRVPGGTTTAEIATTYTEWGWRADAEVMNALAAVERAEDVAAVKGAIVALYRPWLEQCATALQKVVSLSTVSATWPFHSLEVPTSGTCILFTDALRFDVGRRLSESLQERGLVCQVKWNLVALPSITPTAKPAVAPVSGLFAGGSASRLEPVVKAGGTRVTAEVLRKVLEEAGYQALQGDELGDPSGKGWSEIGAIDSYGHQDGWRVAHHLASELRALEHRIEALLDWGWEQVVVVTDHGWLLLPGGLPKVELPEHLTTIRKGRCARLKEGAKTDQQTVPWHWDHNVQIALATGISCYEAGKEYEHGGLSPQECIVPIITVSRPIALAGQIISIEEVTWRGLRCTIRLTGVYQGMTVDIRSKAADPTTSLTTPRTPNAEGTVSVLVADEDYMSSAVFVVVLASDGSVRAQTLTTVGG